MTVDSEEDGQNSLVCQIARGFQATLLARTLSTAAKGLLLVILTRYLLSPDQFGLLFYAISVLAVAHLFATLGFAKSTARYVSEFMETDRAQVRHIIRVGLKYNLLAIVFVGIVLFGFHEHIATALDEPALAPFLLIGPAYVGFKSLRVFLRLIFQGFNRVEWSAVVAVVASVSQLVFVVGFVLLNYGTIGAFVGYVVGLAVTSIVGFTVLYRRFYSRLDEADTIREDLSGRILKYNFPLAWTRGAGTLDGRVDMLLVGYFLTPAAVGFYTLGKQISQFVMMPATALGFVVSPTFGSQKANDNLNRAATIYERSFENILLLYVPAAVGIVLVARPAIRIVFGSDYMGAVPVVQILAVYVIIRSINNITNDALDYLGRARKRAIVKGVGSTANFVLNILLIPILGVVGAAAATVITNAAVVAMNVFFIHRELHLSVRRLLLTTARISGLTTVMAGTVWLVVPFISSILSLIAVVTAGALVWAVLAIVGGLLDVEEIRSFLPSRI